MLHLFLFLRFSNIPISICIFIRSIYTSINFFIIYSITKFTEFKITLPRRGIHNPCLRRDALISSLSRHWIAPIHRYGVHKPHNAHYELIFLNGLSLPSVYSWRELEVAEGWKKIQPVFPQVNACHYLHFLTLTLTTLVQLQYYFPKLE